MSGISAFDVSASGMSAERLRMEVVANNIANAHSTRSSSGGPYQRQQVIFAPALEESLGSQSNSGGLAGVQIAGVENDATPFPKLYDPGHPDAAKDGYVTMPNVAIANEMVDMITASRGYEANLQALRTMRSMVEQTLGVLRAG